MQRSMSSRHTPLSADTNNAYTLTSKNFYRLGKKTENKAITISKVILSRKLDIEMLIFLKIIVKTIKIINDCHN